MGAARCTVFCFLLLLAWLSSSEEAAVVDVQVDDLRLFFCRADLVRGLSRRDLEAGICSSTPWEMKLDDAQPNIISIYMI